MKKQQAALTKFIDEKYIPLELKYKLLIGALLLILPVVLFWFFLFTPNKEEIARLDQQETKLQEELHKAKKKAANLDKFEKILAETREKFDETAIMLPKKKEIPQLLKDISALGQNAGLDFLTFKPKSDVPKDFYSEIPVTINVKGPYHNMGYFLDQVRKLPRIVSVSNIRMSSPKKEGGEMLLKSSCQLVTYRFTNKPLEKKTNKKKRRR